MVDQIVVIQYLGQLIKENQGNGDLVELLEGMQSAYDHNLWHPMTLQLLALFEREDEVSKKIRFSLFEKVIKGVSTSIQPVAFVKLACAAADTLDASKAIAFLGPLQEMSTITNDPPAHSLLITQISLRELEEVPLQADSPKIISAKKRLEKSEALLEGTAGLDYDIHCNHWRLASLIDKLVCDRDSFYVHGLKFIGVYPASKMSSCEKIQWGHELAMSALLSSSLYHFGDLTNSGVFIFMMKESDEHKILVELVLCMERGDASRSLSLLHSLQPLKVFSSGQLLFISEKISLMAICCLLFNRSFSGLERKVAFEEISQSSSVPVENVEFALMKLLSLGLVKGSMDQPLSTFSYYWVHSRSLSLDQASQLRSRIDTWLQRAKNTYRNMLGEVCPV